MEASKHGHMDTVQMWLENGATVDLVHLMVAGTAHGITEPVATFSACFEAIRSIMREMSD